MAIKLTRTITQTLTHLNCNKLSKTGSISNLHNKYIQWISDVKRSFDQYPETEDIFENYKIKKKINKPKHKEYDLMIYNVVMNFLDTSMQKAVKHLYPSGYQVLQDLEGSCSGDRETLKREAEDHFKHAKIKIVMTTVVFVNVVTRRANTLRE